MVLNIDQINRVVNNYILPLDFIDMSSLTAKVSSSKFCKYRPLVRS